MQRWNRGSEWRRWDVHIHAPGTALNNGYPPGCLDEYVARINEAQPPAVAVGITDYMSLRGYLRVLDLWKTGGLPRVGLLFPNIEFRVSPPTQKHRGVNFHLLVDASQPDHIERMQAALQRLTFDVDGEKFNCDATGIAALGRRLDPGATSEEAAYSVGVNAFKVDFSVFREWFRNDHWLREHCLVAVSSGEKDGVSGLPRESGYAATVDEMYRFADIILSANPSDRRYWLGQGTAAPEELVMRYGGLKPCLHGCDAHRLEEVLAPDGERFCWIRADTSFEGLRQVLFEPERRVSIGPDRPGRATGRQLSSVKVSQAAWFPVGCLDLNDGLIAVVGPRGSGKTALADLIAFGADAFEGGPASFLRKAGKEAHGAEVVITWEGEAGTEKRVVGEPPQDQAAVRYLSQHFVESLCSAEGASDRLIREVEAVIFEALDETDRGGAASFAELRDLVTQPIARRIRELSVGISECSEEVAREGAARMDLPAKRKRLAQLDAEMGKTREAAARIVVKGKEEKAKTLQQLRDDIAALEATIAGLKSKDRQLRDRLLDVERQEEEFEERFERDAEELRELGIAESDLPAFRARFDGNVRAILAERLAALKREIEVRSLGLGQPDVEFTALNALRSRADALQKEVGVDTVKERQFQELQRSLRTKATELAKLREEIRRAEGADARIGAAQAKRLERYVAVFSELGRERDALRGLYGPLSQRLANSPTERSGLEFYVRQVADIQGWAAKGEQLIDLRRKSEFQDRGALADKAETLLGNAWRGGDPTAVRTAMEALLELLKDAGRLLVPTATPAAFADWLFSTDHISVTYGIKYEGTEIEHLSDGTRGIVLLILYLALDTGDDRPLIIDQPEENLDPQSVFDVLRGYFREARARRQVVVVTHNPNLVVNTDADQVVVAESRRVVGSVLPHIAYSAGALEDPAIRAAVCRILEGGEQAFLERERRYRLGREI